MADRNASQLSADVLIVGSGPIGATFARVLSESVLTAKILMVDVGPQLTSRPGIATKYRQSRRGRTQPGKEAGRGSRCLPGPAPTWSVPMTLISTGRGCSRLRYQAMSVAWARIGPAHVRLPATPNAYRSSLRTNGTVSSKRRR